MRVLLAEDNTLIGMLFQDEFEDAGWDVAGPALTSADALKLQAEQPCDVALVDLDLADGRTGGALAEALACRYGIPVIFVTGQPKLAAEWRAFALGIIEKPVEPTMLIAVAEAAADTDRRPERARWPEGFVAFQA